VFHRVNKLYAAAQCCLVQARILDQRLHIPVHSETGEEDRKRRRRWHPIVLDYAGRAIRRTRTDQSSSAKSVKRFSQEKRVGLSRRNCLKIKEMERFQRVRGTIDSSTPFVRVGMAGHWRLRLEM